MLNENALFPKSGKPWSPASLHSILQNRLYIGELHKGGASCYQEHLRIVDDELFQDVQHIIQRSAKDALSRRTTAARGTSLLSGFLFCGTCGSRLSSTHIVKHYQKKDGTVRTTRTQKYVCLQRVNGMPCECAGQHTYLADKLDRMVVSALSAHLASVWSKSPSELAEESVRDRRDCVMRQIAEAQDVKQKLEREMQLLHAETLACMEGKSGFSAEHINLMSARNHEALTDIANQLASLYAEQAEIHREFAGAEYLIKKNQARWREFANAPLKRKNRVLSYFLSRVVVKTGYDIQVQFAQIP